MIIVKYYLPKPFCRDVSPCGVFNPFTIQIHPWDCCKRNPEGTPNIKNLTTLIVSILYLRTTLINISLKLKPIQNTDKTENTTSHTWPRQLDISLQKAKPITISNLATYSSGKHTRLFTFLYLKYVSSKAPSKVKLQSLHRPAKVVSRLVGWVFYFKY